MAIKRTHNGKSLIKPGAYSKIVVENLTGFPLASTGTVAIVGEAKGGEPGVLDILTGGGIQAAKARYKSGPIADALELLANPSKDSRIPNGASKIVVFKTNQSTQSMGTLVNAASQGKMALKSKNFGEDENLIKVLISEGSVADKHAEITGTVSGPFVLVGGETLILKVDGVDHTFTNSLSGSVTAAALMAELNDSGNWAPAKPVVASLVAQRIKIALTSGLDMSAMKVEVSSTIDTILGITGSARGEKGSRFVLVQKDLAEELSPELGGEAQISVLYVGSAPSSMLEVKKTSGEIHLVAEGLDIMLEDDEGRNKHSMKSLVDAINLNPDYQAVLVTKNGFTNANELDFYAPVECKHVAMVLKRDDKAMLDYFNVQSSFVEADRFVNGGAIATGQIQMSGAIDGVSANSDYAAAMEAFKEERINCVVPLISKDQGAVSIDSVNALAVSHAAWGWQTDARSERHAFISKKASKKDLIDAAKSAQSGFACLVGQSVRVLDKTGTLVWLEPWALACIAAGMRAGAEVGEPLTFKLINVNDLRVDDGSWSPKKDFADMIEAGVLIAEGLDSGGFRWVVGNTTYGVDASFVWNRESVVQAAGFVAYDLRLNLELAFTGNKAKTGTAEAMANFIKARMSQYLAADIIVGDDLNEGAGYKNLRVNIEGNTAIINISVTPVQGIDFILPTIYLADIRQSV